MPPARILTLEGIRGFAASYVFIGHAGLMYFGLRNGKFGLPFQFGQEAVMLFFLISGFVIHLSVSSSRHMTAAGYLFRRFVRIYPLLLITLGISWAMSWPGSASGGPLWANALMLQDFQQAKPGVWFNTFAGNTALWSLSYEWWFYMLYLPTERLLPAPYRLPIVLGLSMGAAVAYILCPSQILLWLAYYAIWWTGVELAREYMAEGRVTMKRQWPGIAGLATLAVLFGFAALVVKSRGAALSFGDFPLLFVRHFGSAAVFLAVACSLTASGKAIVSRCAKFFVPIAGCSYALYVLHIPLVIQARYAPGLGRTGAFLLYSAIMLVVAFVLEGPVQAAIRRQLIAKPAA